MAWQQQRGASTTTDYDKLYQQDKVKKTYKLMNMFAGGSTAAAYNDDDSLESRARKFEKLQRERQTMQLHAASVAEKDHLLQKIYLSHTS